MFGVHIPKNNVIGDILHEVIKFLLDEMRLNGTMDVDKRKVK